ncbi:MAG: tetratricopeptide repeat protein [Chloroflexi bacterium]|nr:tetratricopeptide repeat protein [Chloroflexota bacterium]
MTLKLDDLCRRADLAIRLGAIDYAVAVCQHILGYFPNHIQARCLLGQAHLEQGALAKAGEQFRSVLEVDPENVLARSGLGVVSMRMGDPAGATEHFEQAYEINPNNPEVAAGLQQIYAQRDGTEPPQLKAPAAAVARWRSHKKQYAHAVKEFDDLLGVQPGNLLLELARAEAVWKNGMTGEAERCCVSILRRAPTCLKAKLILAEILTRDRAREKQGLSLLHEALGIDPGGTVADELFKNTAFKVPRAGEEIEIPLPANGWAETPPQVEAALAVFPKSLVQETEAEWTPPPELLASPPVDEPKVPGDPELARIHADFERIAGSVLHSKGPRVSSPRRAPSKLTELIVTSKRKIVGKYGQEGFERLDAKLRDYQNVLKSFDLDAQLVYVDAEDGMEANGLTPIDPEQPNDVKRVIDRLDVVASQTGRHLGNVLIIGGDSIIPFHRLSNPTQDDDVDVASDNPYGSKDTEFLTPERAVGRMPDAEDAGITLLLAQIDTAMAHRHERAPISEPLGCLAVLFALGVNVKLSVPKLSRSAFGYSALVWKDASASVFQSIGDPSRLLTSPPVTEQVFDLNWLLGSSLNYFNLHGAKDSEFWYGQKDLTYPEDYPMMPVALSPALVAQANVSSSVVFTEACYGAGIIGRSPANCIALRFLSEGALAVVGSTVTSYGVPAPPLSSADLLAVYFWQNVGRGLSIGEALVKAKVSLMNEMLERQGWLDGDDQKTLLEFVLYGDPSCYLDKAPELRKNAHVAQPKRVLRTRPHLFCRRRSSAKQDHEVPKEIIYKAMDHIQTCCPHMHDGSIKIACCVSCDGHCGIYCQCGAGEHHTHEVSTPQKVLTFTSRKIVHAEDGRKVPRLARATLDEVGSVLKTVVSR